MSNYNVWLGYQLINIVKWYWSILTITVLQENKGIMEDVIRLDVTGWSGKKQ